MNQISSVRFRRRVALAAGLFGAVTLVAGGSVLFGPARAQEMAGNIVAFVVWFNFLAGFAYLAAAGGFWLGREWATRLAWAIAAATVVAALVFGWVVVNGAAFEPRTVGALTLRAAIWAGLAWVMSKRRRA